MDIFMTVVILLILYQIVRFSIIFLSDCDILTFFAIKWGKTTETELKGKVVWITGSSSGIGEALAKELAKVPNIKLVLSARRKDELERVKQECLASFPTLADTDVLVLPFDMIDTKVHEKMFKTILEGFGKLDILISNAGRSQRARWCHTDPNVDKELFDLNVFSLVNLNRLVVKYFLDNKIKGHLAIVSSTAGRVGVPFSGSYTASKHALHGYFECLRNETSQHGIQISMICPGPTFSSMLNESFTEEQGKKFGQQVQPTDRRMTAERCAYLSCVGIANGIEEIWLGIFPVIPILYLRTYFPLLSSKLMSVFAKSGYLMKIRDSRITVKGE